MVLVYDNKEESLITMGDDGTGKFIHIPSQLIKYKDGETLKGYLDREETIILVMDFEDHRYIQEFK